MELVKLELILFKKKTDFPKIPITSNPGAAISKK